MSIENNESQVSTAHAATDKETRIVFGAALSASVLWAGAVVNFGGGLALSRGLDRLDANGAFKDGMYFPKYPVTDPLFKCSSEGNVVRISTSETVDENTGDEIIMDLPENYGAQNGACNDGKLSERDGEFWRSRIDSWGLAGLVFRGN